MWTYLAAIAAVFLLLLTWILVAGVAQAFAQRHPEFGQFREKVGCGEGCCGSRCQAEDACDSRRNPLI